MQRLISLICFLLLLTVVTVNAVFAQQNDWEHPELVSSNTLPPQAWFIPYATEKAALDNKGVSGFVQSLDGQWLFKLVNKPADRPEGFYKNGFDVKGWQKIKVPANWQTEGFDKFIFTDVEYPIPPNPPFVPADYNPVGSYKRSFTIPENWKDKNIFIRLGAVNSFFYLWINGHYVGLSKDSKTPATFAITPFLHKGVNTVSVQVFRFSDGTYLEGQDMWKLSGIERSVLLVARPKFCIDDFFIKAGLKNNYTDGVFDLRLTCSGSVAKTGTENGTIKLLDPNGRVIYTDSRLLHRDSVIHFETSIAAVHKWNAESPELYTVILLHTNKQGKIIEVLSQKIGFRSLEVRNGLFLVNGVAVKIKGVNRHEHDMKTGKVITREGMLKDIQLFKQYNINAMRCSHYPNREEWYELCNAYGIYVIDEVNLECDGMSFHPWKTLSDRPEWKAAYLDRTRRMFERDKNFSCIIGWSLGNESGFGDNFIASYQWLKSKDASRPVQYEPADSNQYTDLYVPMYKSIPVWENYVRRQQDRPLILCEYAHMMGNSGGNLKDDWDLFYKHDQLQGGFVWDFSDQTFIKKDKKGRRIWAYGRDMGNVGATSDTSFCADGMFHANRSPHPQAYELRKVYQNIAFEWKAANKLMLTNRFDFTDLQEYKLEWMIKGNGKSLYEGSLSIPSVPAHTSRELDLPVPAFEQKPGMEYFLTVKALTKKSNGLLQADYPVATEQFALPAIKRTDDFDSLNAEPLEYRQTETAISVFNKYISVGFSRQDGWLHSYKIQDSELLYAPLLPHFWREPTDNDIGNSMQIRCAVWQHAAAQAQLDSITVTTLGKYVVQIKTIQQLKSVGAIYKVLYTLYADGKIQVQPTMLAGNLPFPELPRFGMQLYLKYAFDKVSWFGRGPFDNYWDRNYAADVDFYSMPADSLFFPYARAQESGNRTDIRWMALQNKQGLGLMASAEKTISAGVLHFDMNSLGFDRNAPENNHGGSMDNQPFICWNIDYKQMGLGGDNSWGALTHAEYMLPYKNYDYSFILKPVHKFYIAGTILN